MYLLYRFRSISRHSQNVAKFHVRLVFFSPIESVSVVIRRDVPYENNVDRRRGGAIRSAKIFFYTFDRVYECAARVWQTAGRTELPREWHISRITRLGRTGEVRDAKRSGGGWRPSTRDVIKRRHNDVRIAQHLRVNGWRCSWGGSWTRCWTIHHHTLEFARHAVRLQRKDAVKLSSSGRLLYRASSRRSSPNCSLPITRSWNRADRDCCDCRRMSWFVNALLWIIAVKLHRFYSSATLLLFCVSVLVHNKVEIRIRVFLPTSRRI